VSLQLLGQDVSSSLGDLWVRLAHLKHARWGRESAADAETEAQPSRLFATLAALLTEKAHQRNSSSAAISSSSSGSVGSGGSVGSSGGGNSSSDEWPDLPADGNSTARMNRGFDLKRRAPPPNPLDDMPRRPPPKTPIHVWLEHLDKSLRLSHGQPERRVLEQQWHSEASALANPAALGLEKHLHLAVGEVPRQELLHLASVSPSQPCKALIRPVHEQVTPLDFVVEDTSCPLRPVLPDDPSGATATGSSSAEMLAAAAANLKGDDVTADANEVAAFRLDARAAWRPLAAPLEIYKLVSPRPPAAEPPLQGLPFDLSTHGDAQSAVAEDLLARLEADVAGYAKMVHAEQLFDLQGVTDKDVATIAAVHASSPQDAAQCLAQLCATLDTLEDQLARLAAYDQRIAGAALARSVDAANCLDLNHLVGASEGMQEEGTAAPPQGADDEAGLGVGSEAERRLRFSLRRSARQYPPISPSLLTRALMAKDAASHLARANPFLPASVANGPQVLGGLPAVLLRLNRVAHARRATAAVGRCRDLALKLAKSAALERAAIVAVETAAASLPSEESVLGSSGVGVGSVSVAVAFTESTSKSSSSSSDKSGSSGIAMIDNLSKRLQQASRVLVGQLLAERHYLSGPDGQDLASNITDDHNSSMSSGETIATDKHLKPAVWLDPRFLVFEYGFDILLRARQVEMVRSFVEAAHTGESRVQQMIMGAGKTTVIGPLLTLLLADGERLVAQVMPSALLEMSRNVLRKCFTCPLLPKRVYTLSFDRSVEDSAELVDTLRFKLTAAAKGRGVVVAAPEALKSVVLKLVEQLHSVEGADLAQLLAPSTSGRHNRETVKLRDTMCRRATMADALVPILDLWRDSVLVMDEVDVLLHPLRSELNFPIGAKVPIDLGAQRWNLPFFLLDALVALDRGNRTASASGASTSTAAAAAAAAAAHVGDLPTEAAALLSTQARQAHLAAQAEREANRGAAGPATASETGSSSSSGSGGLAGMAVDGPDGSDDDEDQGGVSGVSKVGFAPSARIDKSRATCTESEVRQCLGTLAAVLKEGYECHALQRQPHLVLLDPRWYATKLRPAVAAWASLWLLQECPRIGAVLSSVALASYLTAPLELLQTQRTNVETHLSPAQVKLLNLARSWVLTLLPHVLGKIHRVGFGILRPGDLRMVDPKSPPSRRLLAVPFVGKDVPSRASEFAHPDVLIGLTVRLTMR